jgi:hypothetical protein
VSQQGFAALPRGTNVPAGSDWIHEIKHDGFRLIIQRRGVSVDRPIPLGKFIGERVDGPPARIAEYFI